MAAATRIFAISPPSEVADPEYLRGLRNSLTVALDYALAALEQGEEREPPVPPALLAQARLAARHGVPLDTVLRRYIAGYGLLGEFLVAAAEAGASCERLRLPDLIRGQAAVLDRVVAAVSEEHHRETALRVTRTKHRRIERIKRLLAGELIDATDLNYDLDAHHLAIVGSTSEAAGPIREVAARFNRRLLVELGQDDRVWAWIGGRTPLRAAELRSLVMSIRSSAPENVSLGVGESTVGFDGWGVTYRQAHAALLFALRTSASVARYGEVGLVAALQRDELLLASLRDNYLKPLGEDARLTLRAYFDAERNVSSAAAALGIKRHTVRNRLRAVEESLGRPLNECYLEVDLALRLGDLEEQIGHAARSAS